MAQEVKLPQFSMGMSEGTLLRWFKNEGDAVAAGEPLYEVEAAKTNVEVEAPVSGILRRVLVQVGETVPVYTVLALIGALGEALPDGPMDAGEPAKAAAPSHGAAKVDDSPKRATPLARRLAKDLGIDLADVAGSGPEGRITDGDVRRHAAEAGRAAEGPSGEYEDVPHSAARRFAAQRLTASKTQVPHFYLRVDCEIDALLALRGRINTGHAEGKVTLNDLLIKAAAGALRRVPGANVSWTDTALRRFRTVDISVAVATPDGLYTPVLRGADTKGIHEVSAEMRCLAERARQGKLMPAEYEGGGFSISNLGTHGVREFAAIINPPQACILAVGAGEPRAVVRHGGLRVATVMSCTLSADHRAVDGATGAEFLAAFREIVEKAEPDQLGPLSSSGAG
jgi:pyruvate dehydrogenase E2 component (dihydrolipoamide acetyltransferase)